MASDLVPTTVHLTPAEAEALAASAAYWGRSKNATMRVALRGHLIEQSLHLLADRHPVAMEDLGEQEADEAMAELCEQRSELRRNAFAKVGPKLRPISS